MDIGPAFHPRITARRPHLAPAGQSKPRRGEGCRSNLLYIISVHRMQTTGSPLAGMMHEDEELVARIRAGDLEAFAALYEKYKLGIFRTALAITRDHDSAEEILQDTFVRAFRSIERVDASVPLAPWLHRIGVNLSYNLVRRGPRWSVSLEEVADVLPPSTSPGPEAAAEVNELATIVREAVHSLGIKRRVVIVLYYLQGFTISEIAYVLDLPVGTVKSRLHYATKALRAKLRRDGRLREVLGYASP